MCWILRSRVLLDTGTYEGSLPADSPTIMFTTTTAVGKISSSTMV